MTIAPLPLPLLMALAVVAATAVALRVPFLSVPLIADEAGYAYVVHWVSRGLVLYRDLWFDRPQGIFLVYAALLEVFGPSTEAIRLGAAVYNALTSLLVYALAARLGGRREGLVAAGVFAAASVSPAVEGFTANGELFMNLPAVWAVLLAARRRPFAAGVVLALATAIKPTALPTAAPAMIVFTVLNGPASSPHGHARRATRHAGHGPWAPLLALAGGAVAGAAPFAAHGLWADAAGYWYAVAGFRFLQDSAFVAGGRFFSELQQTAPRVVLALLPVWLLLAFWLSDRRWQWPGGVGLLVFLVGGVSGAALGGYWYWHYFVGVLPAASIIAAQAALRPAATGAGRRLVAVAGATAVGVVFNARLLGATPEQTSWNVYGEPVYLASRTIAAYLQAHTDPADTVYVAFAQPDLYYLCGRRSAGRHLYWTEVNRIPGAFDAVLAALDEPAHQPKYVVAVHRDLELPGRASAFWERVDERYRPETTIAGFVLYRLLASGLPPLATPAEPIPAGVAGDTLRDGRD